MKAPKTFTEMTSALSAIQPVRRELYKLGIEISDYSEIVLIFPDYIREKLDALCFFEQLNLDQEIALILACTQEDRNNYLDQSEIDFINKFFDLKITGEEINRIGSEYI